MEVSGEPPALAALPLYWGINFTQYTEKLKEIL